jgi:hypothetical protein
MVTAVGLLNFLVAALGLPLGIMLLVLASALASTTFMTPFGMVGGGGPVVTVLRVLAVLEFVCDAALILAGIGVLLRKPWGRALTLVLAGLMLLSTLGNLSSPAVTTGLGALLHVGFAVFALVILLRPRYAAEFRQPAVPFPAERPPQRLAGHAGVAAAPGGAARGFGWRAVLVLLATHILCLVVGLFAQAGVVALEREVQARPGFREPFLFTQQGQLTLRGDKEFTVYYAQPYVSEPNLTVELVSGGDAQLFVKEQQKNSFTVVPTTRPGTSVTIRWIAKGRLRD